VSPCGLTFAATGRQISSTFRLILAFIMQKIDLVLQNIFLVELKNDVVKWKISVVELKNDVVK
jgi:hypothetical protein